MDQCMVLKQKIKHYVISSNVTMEKQYFIFRRICELAVNSNVRTSEKWFDFEIDSE